MAGSPLFDQRPRKDRRRIQPGETFCAFLDRVDSEYFAEMRRVLNAWFGHFPVAEQDELRARLADDEQWQAAFWELLLHELYSRAGFTLDVHPVLAGTDGRPDFLVSGHGARFVIEARVVTATSDDRRRRDRRLKTIVDAINRLRPHSFYLKLDIVVEGRGQPPVGPVGSKLQGWLAGLDASAVADCVQRHGGTLRGAPSLEVPTGDWVLRFSAIPVDPERRGKLTGPMVGIGPVEVSVSDPTAAIRTALRRKGGRYGAEYPLVVALGVEEPGVEDGDVAAALFGRVVTQLGLDHGLIAEYRQDDGYWSARRRVGARVAAVLTARFPRLWTLPDLVPRLWLNPWARVPYLAPRVWEWVTFDPTNDAFIDGPAETTTAHLLGLPSGWPPGDPRDGNEGSSPA